MSMYKVVATKELPSSIADGMTVYAVSRNDGKKGKSGIVCVAPAVSDALVSVFQNSAVGKAFIVDAMEGLRSRIISKLHASGKTIHDESIGITAMTLLAKQETESQRMTKEAIGAWFDADLMKLIADAIAAKLDGISTEKLTKLVEGYRSKFQTLAGREVSMPAAVKAQLIRAMEFLPEDYESVIGEKVAAALAESEEATETLAAL